MQTYFIPRTAGRVHFSQYSSHDFLPAYTKDVLELCNEFGIYGAGGQTKNCPIGFTLPNRRNSENYPLSLLELFNLTSLIICVFIPLTFILFHQKVTLKTFFFHVHGK